MKSTRGPIKISHVVVANYTERDMWIACYFMQGFFNCRQPCTGSGNYVCALTNGQNREGEADKTKGKFRVFAIKVALLALDRLTGQKQTRTCADAPESVRSD